MIHQGFEIKQASAAQVRVIAQMSRDLIEDGLGWSWRAGRVAVSLQSEDSIVVVATPQHAPAQVAGFAIMQFLPEHAHLALLAVAPKYRRKGLGRALLAWLERCALDAGISKIQLEVRASRREARTFYHALGYRERERVPAYYRGVETAIRMTRELWEDALREPRALDAPFLQDWDAWWQKRSKDS